MTIPVLVRSVGPEPSAGYYTQWTTFVPGYPKFKNADTGVSQAFYAPDGVTLTAYRAHYLYFTGQTGEIVDRLVDFNVGLIPGVGEYYDIPVTAYDPGSTGLNPSPGSSSGTAQPSGPARLDITVSESFALSTGDLKVTPWHTPNFVREREITGERWANLFGATQEADGTAASRALSTAYETQLVAQDFRFSLPSAAAITGIEFEVNRRGDAGVQEKVSLIRCFGLEGGGLGFAALSYGSATAAYSADGVSWDQQALPASANWYTMAWNGSVFCALANNSTIAATSPDGITWTQRTLPVSASWWDITWNGSLFCAIANGSSIAATSPDGITWTQRTLPVSANWVALTWGGGVFCAITNNSTIAATSPDGITWTQRTLPANIAWSEIEWNGSVFCAIASGTTTAATSPDGVTWTLRTLPITGTWYELKWNGSLFCALRYNSTIAITSPDGITWTQRTLPVSGAWFTLAWNGSAFCALSYNTDTAITSPDGITWTQRTLPVAAPWFVLSEGGNASAEISVNGSFDEGLTLPDGAVYTCEPLIAYSDLAVPTNYATNRAGGDGSLFSHAWTAQEINSESFGVIYEAKGAGGLAALDAVRVRVHYRADPTTDTLPAKRSAGLSGVAESPNGVKVAVGADGRILRKPANNPTWASVASGTTVSLNAVEWVGDRFVAVGMFGMALDGGADGSTWTRIDTGAVSSLWAIKRVPNSLRAVAVGNDDFSFERGRNGGWST